MRVLQTGFTVRHAGMKKIRTPIEIWDESQMFNKLFHDMDFDVEWRPGEVGEDLSNFDLVFVYLASPKSITSRWSPGAIWSMLQAHQQNIPTLLFFGDWDHYIIYAGMRSLAKNHQQITKYVWGEPFYWTDKDQTAFYAEAMSNFLKGFDYASSPLWSKALGFYAKMSGIGDPINMRHPRVPMAPLATFDPTPYVLAEYQISKFEGRKSHRWSMAALADTREWIQSLRCEWPVDIYGPTKFGGERLKDENEVIDRYSKTWGVLSPPRYNAGGGDYRIRSLVTPLIGSILWGGPKDNEMFGPEFCHPINEIERMTNTQLAELAEVQYQVTKQRLLTDPKKCIEEMSGLIEQARKRAKG